MQAVTDKQALKVLAKNVQERRKAKGLSLRKLAQQIKDYPTSIKRIEDGKSMPGAGLLTRLADALDTSPDGLLGITSNGFSEPH
jgi:transcriptional regulator with XRE-family HTH domain